MHPTTRKIRDKLEITQKEWATRNGEDPDYVQRVIAGKRGVLNWGAAKRIIGKLKKQRLWVEPKKEEAA